MTNPYGIVDQSEGQSTPEKKRKALPRSKYDEPLDNLMYPTMWAPPVMFDG